MISKKDVRLKKRKKLYDSRRINFTEVSEDMEQNKIFKCKTGKSMLVEL